MAGYRNPRRAAETTFFLLSFKQVVVFGANEIGDTEQATIDHINRALDDYQESIRRARELLGIVLEPFIEKEEHVSKFGLAVYYMAQNLLEQNALTLPDNLSIDGILEALAEFTTVEYAKLDRSAFKAARRAFTQCQEAGYFRNARWVIEFEEASL